jgi:hypothetical protein
MSQRQELINFLNGDTQADQARTHLAAQGPAVIPQLVEALLDVLKALGRYAATQASSYDAENKIDLAAGRAWSLVTSIALASPESGSRASTGLKLGLRGGNPNMRAVCVLLGSAEGTESDAYLQAIANCFLNDSVYLPKVAAAIYLAAFTDGTDNLTQMARGVASDWINGYAVPKYPRLAQTAAQMDPAQIVNEWTQKMVIGFGAVYREIAHS